MKKVEEALKNYYENGFEWLDEEEYGLLYDHIHDNVVKVKTLYRGLNLSIEEIEEMDIIEPQDEEPFASVSHTLAYARNFGDVVLVFSNEEAFKLNENESLILNEGGYEIEEIENVNEGEYYLVHLG